MINSIYECNTLEDLILYGKSLDISHDKLHFKASFLDNSNNIIIFNYSSLIQKYKYFLEKYIRTIEFNDVEYEKYRFKPKSLSVDLYGTTELWSAILRINNVLSINEFSLKKIKLFTTEILSALNEILILEEKNIKENRSNNSI